MKTVLLLSFSNLIRDPRVHRHGVCLAETFRVVTAGYGGAPSYASEHIEIPSPRQSGLFKKLLKAVFLFLRIYAPVYWLDDDKRRARALLKDRQYDVIVANDASSLPVAFSVSGKQTPVLADMHEFAPGEQLEGWKWNFFWKGYPEYLCRRYLIKAKKVVTVCESIAELYQAEFLGERPGVLMNCPSYIDARPRPLHAQIKLVHHGLGCPSRKLELMAEAALLLDERFAFEFMLVESNKAYCDSLKAKYSGAKITFREPVPMTEIAKVLNEDYDMGVFLLEPEAVNYKYALPNKLFEFIQARLAVAISPSVEMAALVSATGVGVIAEDFTSISLARAINALDNDQIMAMKEASSVAAQRYSSEAVYRDFKRLVDAVAG
ncbi:glycosyltransferase [Pseudomonas sp. EMN2]|uniref:glycosyltransferase n=1 Tax=Pseudomonas sp. EMN2 TaxID=2615212 RepID=UPI00129BAF3C|nr:glycosyltransferase [Pseudomonas sp. EMN2]